jgi:hypothetical protein
LAALIYVQNADDAAENTIFPSQSADLLADLFKSLSGRCFGRF